MSLFQVKGTLLFWLKKKKKKFAEKIAFDDLLMHQSPICFLSMDISRGNDP